MNSLGSNRSKVQRLYNRWWPFNTSSSSSSGGCGSINYKLCLIVHKSLLGQTPQYISNLLVPVADIPARSNLYERRQINGDIFVPRTKRTIGMHMRALNSVAAARVWNTILPTDLKRQPTTATFKRKLKTFLNAAMD